MPSGGFKTFVSGEILTASDVNSYLMQGINVFAGTAARGSAITSPVEGQFAYLNDTNKLTYYDGSAWKEFSSAVSVDYLIVAGGGSGCATKLSDRNGGGGGGGGYLTGTVTLMSGVSYPLTIGAGGAGLSASSYGNVGNNSRLAEIVVPGGGGGMGFTTGTIPTGASGGGIGSGNPTTAVRGISGFGNNGGGADNVGGGAYGAGGGGGGGSAGSNGTSSVGGAGGSGAISTIISTTLATAQSVGQVSGSSVYFSGGGGGGRINGSAGGGGLGGGSNGATGSNASTNAAANTGGGSGGSAGGNSGNGGSGVVIFKLPSVTTVTFSGGVTSHAEASGLDTIYIIKAAGPTDTFTIS